MTYNTNTAAAGFGLAQRFHAFRAEFAEKAAKRKIYRQTMSELEALSSRDLADLGINASTIKSIAYEAAYGK